MTRIPALAAQDMFMKGQAMSAPANFNGQLPVIDPDDAVMLLIDHQSGLFQTVGDMPMPVLRRHAAALAGTLTSW